LSYFHDRNSSLNSCDISFVKIGSTLSEKSIEKSAISLFPVLATKFDAFFHTEMNSSSSPVSLMYEFTFFITLMLYPQHNHLFEVITTARVLSHFHS